MRVFKEIKFDPRTNNSFLKNHLPEKIASACLRFKDLDEVCNECGKDGLIAILSKPLSNSSLSFPRATRHTQILAAIADQFTTYYQAIAIYGIIIIFLERTTLSSLYDWAIFQTMIDPRLGLR